MISSVYPVLMTDRVDETAAFYAQWFGFERTFDSDWYVSLAKTESDRVFELALLTPGHETIPEGFGKASAGVLVNVEVDDATADYARIVTDGGSRCVLHLKDEEFGQRHFIVVDPAGNLVDVIENIPPSEEFAAQYLEG